MHTSSSARQRTITVPAAGDRPGPHPGTGIRPVPGSRALVLGGGGSTGNAWLIGVLAGLADAGVDVTDADLTIGTSAGATAAAQLGGATAAELYAAVLDSGTPPAGSVAGPTGGAPATAGSAGPARADGRAEPAGSVRAPGAPGTPADRAQSRAAGFPEGAASHLERLRALIAASDGPADMRRRVGAAALGDPEDPGAERLGAERSARWREVVAARLPAQDWPERDVILTAVDARTGDPVLLDRESGIDLADAVAASCAGGGFAHRIGDRRYIDGGYRGNAENADLAAGSERVLVLSPLSGGSLHPEEWGTRLSGQVDALREQGSRVEMVFPPDGAGHLFGENAMNAALRPEAARAGFDQGRAIAGRISALWG